MRKSRFGEGPVIAILKVSQAQLKTAVLCRNYHIGDAVCLRGGATATRV